MQRFIQFRFVVLILSLLMVFGIIRVARAAIYAGSDGAWLVVSSHSFQQDAVDQAQQYINDFPTTSVLSASNGYFVIALGWARKHAQANILNDLKLRGRVPSDSYYSKGARWINPVWSANNSHFGDLKDFVAATQLYNGNQQNPGIQDPQVVTLPPTPAEVFNLEHTSDKYLSLRRGPSTSYQEIARLLQGTQLTITGRSKSWFRVELESGEKGFAHSKYIKMADVPIIGPDKNWDGQTEGGGPNKENYDPASGAD